MTIKHITKTIAEEVYIAEDGKEFSNQEKCMYYEWKLTAQKLYSVTERGLRNIRIENIDIFSTLEKAVEYINMLPNPKQFIIIEHYLDEAVRIKSTKV